MKPNPHTCNVHTGGEPCGRCVCCNVDIADASNQYFNRDLVRDFCEIRPGVFILYGSRGRVEYCGDFIGLEEAYRQRSPHEPYHRAPRPSSSNGPRRAGKISAAQRAANTAKLLALMKGPKSD